MDSRFLFQCSTANSLEEATHAIQFSELSEFWWLILFCIGVTNRNDDWIAKLTSIPDKNLTKDQLVDGLFVTFMFNLINEIANRYDLQPEWSMIEWSGTVRKKLLQIALPSFVKMEQISCENDIDLTTNLSASITQLKLRGLSEMWNSLGSKYVWECFNEYPRIAITIQQIFFAAALIGKHRDRGNCDENFQTVFCKAVEEAVMKLSNSMVNAAILLFAHHPE